MSNFKSIKISEAETGRFNKLLTWLDPDPVAAGAAYEIIRGGLIKIFTARRCPGAEDLADSVIERVTAKIDHLIDGYEGEPVKYFYAVARNVYYESARSVIAAPLTGEFPAERSETENDDPDIECFRACLQQLEPADRQLICDYYRLDDAMKKQYREKLSARLGITVKHLRVRAFRLRHRLQECARKCRAKKKL